MEEDSEDSNQHQTTKLMVFTKGEEDVIYKVDLKNYKFASVFERIGRLFEGNYLNFIRSIENPIVKEIYILLRKYQYFFTKMTLNNILLFDFSKSSDCLLNKLSDYEFESSKNTFAFEIKILPKFKKNEINFEIPENLLILAITVEVDAKDNQDNLSTYLPGKTKVEILNFQNVKDIEHVICNMLSTMMSKILSSFFESYKSNFIHALNKFLTYVENYFPEVHKKAFEQQLLQKDIWTQDEQDRLEEALLKYNAEKNAKEKFRKVAEFVRTKSLAECVKRYKKLSEKRKGEKKEDITDQIFTEKNVKVNQAQSSHSNSSRSNDSENPSDTFTDQKENTKREVKIRPNNDPSKREENPQPQEELIIIPKSNNTYDLVDDIINQFNSLYTNVTFETQTDNPYNLDENEINTFYCDKGDEENYVEEVENEEEDDDMDYEEEKNKKSSVKENKNKSGRNNNKSVKEINKPPVNISMSTSEEDQIKLKYNSQITSSNLELIRSIFKFGEKASFNIGGLVLKNIALGEISEPKFFVKCGKCKQIGFETAFMKFNKKFNIFYNVAICPKCKNEMHIIFKSELLHPENLKVGGYIFSIGVIIMDFLPMTYMINCLDCTETYKKVKLRVGGLPSNDKECRTCGKEMLFYIYNGNVAPASVNNFSFLDNFEILNFQKFNLTIEDTSGEYIKKYDRPFQVGNPLPDKGVCRHYKLSFRWFRFGCCSKLFPCDVCHDEISNHESEYAKTILCGYCSFEQTSQNEVCQKCGKSFTKDAGKGFWEGGKGCRNKAMMSNKDSHKFKNSDMKTISKKKMAELKGDK